MVQEANKVVFVNIFKIRVIELTSERITMSNEYFELKRTLDNTSFSDRTRTRLAKRLINKKQVLDHIDKNLNINIHLSKK